MLLGVYTMRNKPHQLPSTPNKPYQAPLSTTGPQ